MNLAVASPAVLANVQVRAGRERGPHAGPSPGGPARRRRRSRQAAAARLPAEERALLEVGASRQPESKVRSTMGLEPLASAKAAAAAGAATRGPSAALAEQVAAKTPAAPVQAVKVESPFSGGGQAAAGSKEAQEKQAAEGQKAVNTAIDKVYARKQELKTEKAMRAAARAAAMQAAMEATLNNGLKKEVDGAMQEAKRDVQHEVPPMLTAMPRSAEDASTRQPSNDATLRKVVQEEVARALGRGGAPVAGAPRQGPPTAAKTRSFPTPMQRAPGPPVQQPGFAAPGGGGGAMTPNMRGRSGDGASWDLGQGGAMNSVAKSAAKAMQHVGKIVPTVDQAVAGQPPQVQAPAKVAAEAIRAIMESSVQEVKAIMGAAIEQVKANMGAAVSEVKANIASSETRASELANRPGLGAVQAAAAEASPEASRASAPELAKDARQTPPPPDLADPRAAARPGAAAVGGQADRNETRSAELIASQAADLR